MKKKITKTMMTFSKFNPVHSAEITHHLELPNLTSEEVKTFFACLDKYLCKTEVAHRYEKDEDGNKCLRLPCTPRSLKIDAFIDGYLMALGVDENGNRL